MKQPQITSARCAAHDVQLSVHDVLKKKSLSSFLAKVRKLVKTLKVQPYVNSFRLDKSKPLPFLDGETRWGSAHLMVQRILDLKDFILAILPADILKTFNNSFWKAVDNFVTSTKPVFILSKRVQEESLTCGSFYLYWQECCLELTEIGTTLAKQLENCLQKRNYMWFDNPAFMAALLVDPRLSGFHPSILSVEQKEQAIVRITKIKFYHNLILF